jgi:hypothetical protein
MRLAPPRDCDSDGLILFTRQLDDAAGGARAISFITNPVGVKYQAMSHFVNRLYRDHLGSVSPHGSRRVGLRIEPAYQHDFQSRLVRIFSGMLDAPARPCLLRRFADVFPCDDDATAASVFHLGDAA